MVNFTENVLFWLCHHPATAICIVVAILLAILWAITKENEAQ